MADGGDPHGPTTDPFPFESRFAEPDGHVVHGVDKGSQPT
jgi:hypothetical protein